MCICWFLLHKFKYSLMHGYGMYLSQVLCQLFVLFCIYHHIYVIY